jgi:hypothetical protein
VTPERAHLREIARAKVAQDAAPMTGEQHAPTAAIRPGAVANAERQQAKQDDGRESAA